MLGTDRRSGIWPLWLEKIEATDAAHLGPGAVLETEKNSVSAVRFQCIWRSTQAAGAHRASANSTTAAITRPCCTLSGRSNKLRIADDSIDALVEMLRSAPNPEME